MEKEYKIDDRPVTFQELIKEAEALGYRESSGIYMTSRAARVLRANGHTVSENK